MAKSPAHRFGQIIGDILEDTLIEYFAPIARDHGLYVDYKHARAARNGKKEVQWKDINGNQHKLDIVLEEGGSEAHIGVPKAFVEVAWRRYKKHAKAKAQEISAAITPLVAKYSSSGPFFGAILAGEFTENSLMQMKSEGFEVLYFSTQTIEETFACFGINAHWDEKTSEEELQRRVDQADAMTAEEKQAVGKRLMDTNRDHWDRFVGKLQIALERAIEEIRVTALYGRTESFLTVDAACGYVLDSGEVVGEPQTALHRYEITVAYTNGDRIDMQFREKSNAIQFLRQLEK